MPTPRVAESAHHRLGGPDHEPSISSASSQALRRVSRDRPPGVSSWTGYPSLSFRGNCGCCSERACRDGFPTFTPKKLRPPVISALQPASCVTSLASAASRIAAVCNGAGRQSFSLSLAIIALQTRFLLVFATPTRRLRAENCRMNCLRQVQHKELDCSAVLRPQARAKNKREFIAGVPPVEQEDGLQRVRSRSGLLHEPVRNRKMTGETLVDQTRIRNKIQCGFTRYSGIIRIQALRTCPPVDGSTELVQMPWAEDAQILAVNEHPAPLLSCYLAY